MKPLIQNTSFKLAYMDTLQDLNIFVVIWNQTISIKTQAERSRKLEVDAHELKRQ